MLVQQILQSKSSDEVITVKPGTSVSDAAKILAKHKFGSVVVSRDGTTADGILSERDIVRELAMRGATCLQDPVEAYMTTKLVTCTRQDSVESVLQHMSDGRFRHMPVVEEGKLVGLITQGDVVKARLSKVSMEKEALQGMIMGH
ncbi:CBS domain-containing protein [Pseudosulfitobacter pseudonitzschiae]|uniref:Histidine kinase n=1 Tax=Pseudosulfitobacter pseudonitzschiae TaxID=1402135 RepID=A0A073J7T1_9RHOB|nr:CBS domain-containing protein [Pseudosulfitobacter pseudonitzschiae]KEJ97865.1 histidine kinase [Pseudosulfitobacter pseudonitzschiae]MBM1814460.1 CBS domain-containing protein [Pseudosulfitobacter pseudonitzschiae]MBM1831453.1 CBS domain-containing protein [Pseudosulfitobacter pseudonitzschiae]MBM1836320.1 CBS domain-containing protein [Pseudosulfitobacter pseudonitzschiae]MBM1841166.1 CBS domain-containing protein [Pseudosulfitobacter pseudonitzschiae]